MEVFVFLNELLEVAIGTVFGYDVGVIRGIQNIHQFYNVAMVQLFHDLDFLEQQLGLVIRHQTLLVNHFYCVGLPRGAVSGKVHRPVGPPPQNSLKRKFIVCYFFIGCKAEQMSHVII